MTISGSVPVQVFRDYDIGGEKFTLFQTRHGDVVAETALHHEGLPTSVGGIRMVVQGDRRELGHLSAAMTEKSLAAGLPCHGQKSLVVCPSGLPVGNEARAAILEEHIRAVSRLAPGVIFGPDMNTSEQILDIVAADPELRRHVGGLSEVWGGLAIDKEGYTGAGVAAAIEVARQKRPDLGLDSASIQGFGAVGAHCARLLDRTGVVLRAASIAEGVMIAKDPQKGLPVAELFAAWQRGGDRELKAFALAHADSIVWDSDPDRLLEVEARIFVPAARTTVLATFAELAEARLENPQVRDVLAFAKATGVRLVAEGANHPLTYRAEEELEARGVVILPDFICNAGGLVGCYFEWYQRPRVLGAPRERARVTRAARGYADEVICRNTAKILESKAGARAAARAIVAEAEARWAKSADPAAEWRAVADRLLQESALRLDESAPPSV